MWLAAVDAKLGQILTRVGALEEKVDAEVLQDKVCTLTNQVALLTDKIVVVIATMSRWEAQAYPMMVTSIQPIHAGQGGVSSSNPYVEHSLGGPCGDDQWVTSYTVQEGGTSEKQFVDDHAFIGGPCVDDHGVTSHTIQEGFKGYSKSQRKNHNRRARKKGTGENVDHTSAVTEEVESSSYDGSRSNTNEDQNSSKTYVDHHHHHHHHHHHLMLGLHAFAAGQNALAFVKTLSLLSTLHRIFDPPTPSGSLHLQALVPATPPVPRPPAALCQDALARSTLSTWPWSMERSTLYEQPWSKNALL